MENEDREKLPPGSIESEPAPELQVFTVPVLITHGNRDLKKGIKCTQLHQDGGVMEECVLMPGGNLSLSLDDKARLIKLEIVDNP